MNAEEFYDAARGNRLVAVIRAGSPEEAVQKSLRALEAGIQLVEIACTTPKAAEAIRAVKQKAPLVGAGTVLTTRDADAVLEAGAEFVLGPNFSREVRDLLRDRGVVYIPGVFTPSDVGLCQMAGLTTLKLFPAATGGIPHLRALREPFVGLSWIPTGGITWDAVDDWLKAGALAVGMGSALFQHPDLPTRISRLKEEWA